MRPATSTIRSLNKIEMTEIVLNTSLITPSARVIYSNGEKFPKVRTRQRTVFDIKKLNTVAKLDSEMNIQVKLSNNNPDRIRNMWPKVGQAWDM